MNTTKFLKTAAVMGALLVSSFTLNAQALYRLSGKTELKVKGTSTLHDWEMTSTTATGKAELTLDGQTVKSIKSAEVSMKAETLKSGKEQMDNIAYKSLKTENNPTISFKYASFKSLSNNNLLVTGLLTIAGTTKQVTFKVQPQVEDGVLQLKGETAIKFTDFNLSPPTAMFGTIKTGNELTLLFKTSFHPINI
ncbi:YceI family protein [Pontibacter harenae]|uniref:YceI family protein n=1 Tax=Pontibacter harenae TaxID=2894083 RepID=UPI001E493867|nr:YceI family protein [Pontibacter harenae]MCC9165837.1 YceI family protein [Pontibacter harenae]